MKTLTFALISMLVSPAIAEEPKLPGRSFPGEKIEIIWSATNQFPSNVWIYKVVSQEFSPMVISNLMALGNFTEKNRSTPDGRPNTYKQLRYYENIEGNRQLSIYPPYGYVYYRDERATVVPPELPKGVPEESDVLPLALKWVGLFGLAPVELARKEYSFDYDILREKQTQTWVDKTNGHHSDVILRGIFFTRCVDGISFTSGGSDGGFQIAFGNDGTVAEMELVWRNLKRHKCCKVASPTQIISFIKKGDAKIVPLTEMDLAHAKTLTINKAAMSYLGCNGEKPQDYMYSFVALVCTVGFDDGATKQIVLQCPIIAE
jgi:hypothetical protein